MAERWPPPVEAGTVWRTVRLGRSHSAEHPMVRLRKVWLWGREVEIDDVGDVFCRCCWQCVSVRVLGRPGNGHHASPWPADPRMRSYGPGNPMPPDDGPKRRRARYNPQTMSF